jgi:hypothetical protein
LTLPKASTVITNEHAIAKYSDDFDSIAAIDEESIKNFQVYYYYIKLIMKNVNNYLFIVITLSHLCII